MKLIHINLFLICNLLLVPFNLSALGSNDVGESLEDLIYEIERGVDEPNYNLLSSNAIKIISSKGSILKNKSVSEVFNLHPSLLTKTIGPLLESDISEFRYNANNRGDFNSYLSLAMLQDKASINLIVSKIFDENRFVQFEYIKLLALYGKDGNKYIPLLHWIKENHWYKPVIDISNRVIDIINNSNAQLSNWDRVKLWNELESIDGYSCNKSSNHATKLPLNSTKKSFNPEDIKIIESMGLSTVGIISIWKNINTFKYLINKDNSLTGISFDNKVINIENLPSYYKLNEIFEINSRLFLIADINNSLKRKSIIFEIVVDNDMFIYHQVFSLGESFTAIDKTMKSVTLTGINWSYSINQDALIESGVICGQKVLINKPL